MNQTVDKKYMFLILGIFLIIFSPLIVILVPIFVPMTFYFEKYTWFYYTPTTTYVLLSIALGLLVICCALLLYFNKKKWSIWSSISLTILSIVLMVFSVLQYTAMNDSGIKYRALWSTDIQEYSWEDVASARIVEVLESQKGITTLHFTMVDGTEIVLKQNSNVLQARSGISAKLKQNNIKIQYEQLNDEQ